MASPILHDLFQSERARMLWGLFFVVMGLGWIVDNYLPAAYKINVGNLWPLALVILGFLVFLSRDRMGALQRSGSANEADAAPNER